MLLGRILHKRTLHICWPNLSKVSSLQNREFANTTVTAHMAKQGPRQPAYKPQNYDYFLILDFEATCEKNVKLNPQEIIEFPVLKVNGKTFETEATFHQYIEPRVNNELSSFCTELTGIIQDMVDGQPHLEEVLDNLNKWMLQEGLLDPNVSSVFVTCGDWDLQTMLPNQCKYFNILYPAYLKKWINIKKPYNDVMGHWGKGMMQMLKTLKLQHEGRHHSGIDDCKNIANILRGLAERGYIFKQTGQL